MITWPPIEIVLAVIAAVIVRMKSASTLSWIGATTTMVTGIVAGLFLYKDVAAILGLGPEYHTIIAVVIALTAENIMKIIIDASNHPDSIFRVFKAFLIRDPSALTSKKDD